MDNLTVRHQWMVDAWNGQPSSSSNLGEWKTNASDSFLRMTNKKQIEQYYEPLSLVGIDVGTIKEIKQEMQMLLHAARCRKPNSSKPMLNNHYNEEDLCFLNQCESFKEALKHMSKCKPGLHCSETNCKRFRQLIGHWKSCVDDSCTICLSPKCVHLCNADNPEKVLDSKRAFGKVDVSPDSTVVEVIPPNECLKLKDLILYNEENGLHFVRPLAGDETSTPVHTHRPQTISPDSFAAYKPPQSSMSGVFQLESREMPTIVKYSCLVPSTGVAGAEAAIPKQGRQPYASTTAKQKVKDKHKKQKENDLHYEAVEATSSMEDRQTHLMNLDSSAKSTGRVIVTIPPNQNEESRGTVRKRGRPCKRKNKNTPDEIKSTRKSLRLALARSKVEY